jgi:hypothetical protein
MPVLSIELRKFRIFAYVIIPSRVDFTQYAFPMDVLLESVVVRNVIVSHGVGV